MSSSNFRLGISLSAVAMTICVPAVVQAQTRTFNIAAQPASSGIREFAQQAGIQVIAAGRDAEGLRTNAVKGAMDVRAALDRLLEGTGLAVRSFNNDVAVLAASDDASILVTGSVLQTQKDIASRRNSTLVVDTLSQDDIQSLPDTTIADSLRRITGVTTLNNDDIGQFASIRGVNPDLVPVTVNGINLASIGDTGGGRRQANLQVIPSRAVQQLQAYKSSTPDMESGSMGGLINLVPASAYDFHKRTLIAEVSTNYSTDMDTSNVNTAGGNKGSPLGSGAALTYAQTFGGNDQFGVVLNGFWQQRVKDQQNDTIPGRLYYKNSGVATNPEDPNWNGAAVPSQFGSYNYTNRYRAWGGSVMLEFRPSDNFKSSLFGFLYNNNESETRNYWHLYTFSNPTNITENTGTITAKSADTEWRHNTFERNTRGLIWSNHLDTGKAGVFDFRAGYTYAGWHNIQPVADYLYSGVNQQVSYDMTADQRFTLANPDALINAANYKLNGASITEMNAFQDVADAQLDYKFNAGEKDRGFGFMTGLAFRHLYLARDYSATVYNTDKSAMTGYSVVPGTVMGIPYPVMWLDQQAFWSTAVPKLTVNAAGSASSSLASDYQYSENIFNAYGALTFATEKLRVIAGLRYDHTNFTAAAPETIDGAYQQAFAKSQGEYEKLLPSINALYSFTPQLRLKAGYSRTLGRPNPQDIAAVETIAEDDNTITRGNPNLRPRVSDNFELGLEHYFNHGNGMLTLGLFAKDVKGDILTVEHEEVLNGETYFVTEPINGDKSTYRGVEIGFVDNKLDFLPGPLANLGVSGNLLYVKGRTAYTYNGERRVKNQLFNQMKWAGNAALFYNVADKGEVRVAYNYQSKYIDTLGDDPWLDIGYGAYDTVDVTVRYDLSEHWRVQAEARNLLNNNRTRLIGPDLRYTRADIEYGNLFFLRLIYTM
jgi:TonB-dependent receptor